MRLGAFNLLIPPTNVSSKYDLYVTSSAVFPTATKYAAPPCNHSRQQRKSENVKPGRRGTEKEIAPVRGDVTNGRGQRVSNPPSKGIMHSKLPYMR